MAFWGTVVKPGKHETFVPPPLDWNLHLSQATLEPTVPEGKRVAVSVKSDPEEEPIIICTLTAGRTDTALLDLFFSQYTEFSVMGEYPVHLSGYYTPAQNPDEDDDGEDEDDEEYEPGAVGFPVGPGGDEDEDEDDEDEELDGMGEDEDEDEDAMDGEGQMFDYQAMLAAVGRRRKTQVTIEDVTDEGKADDSKAAKGKEQKGGKTAKQQAEQEDDEDEDEDGEDEDEDEESEDEDEESEDEEEPAPAKGGKQAAQAGGKRAADGPVTKGDAEAEKPAKKQAIGQEQPQPAPAAKGKDAKKEAKQQEQQKQKQQEAKQQAKQPEAKQPEAKPAKKSIRRHPNGFEIEDVTIGSPNGKLAKPGQKVLVRYAGRLKSNGKVFDKSGAKPFQFRLGVGEVIKGWDLGVEGMRVGDKRRLLIPPQLAYGSSGVRGTIPPNATLEFDVELVDVK